MRSVSQEPSGGSRSEATLAVSGEGYVAESSGHGGGCSGRPDPVTGGSGGAGGAGGGQAEGGDTRGSGAGRVCR